VVEGGAEDAVAVEDEAAVEAPAVEVATVTAVVTVMVSKAPGVDLGAIGLTMWTWLYVGIG
jgi:hypothetical protein